MVVRSLCIKDAKYGYDMREISQLSLNMMWNFWIPTFLIRETESSREIEGDFLRWNMAVSSTSTGTAFLAPSLDSTDVCLRRTAGLEADCKDILGIQYIHGN